MNRHFMQRTQKNFKIQIAYQVI